MKPRGAHYSSFINHGLTLARLRGRFLIVMGKVIVNFRRSRDFLKRKPLRVAEAAFR